LLSIQNTPNWLRYSVMDGVDVGASFASPLSFFFFVGLLFFQRSEVLRLRGPGKSDCLTDGAGPSFMVVFFFLEDFSGWFRVLDN